MQIDMTTEFGARVARRLQDEMVIWLTTVDGAQRPHPSPVWFLWDGQRLLVYSRPDAGKVRNIARNPRVALSFDGDGRGGNIIVISATASIDPTLPSAIAMPDYLAKYRAGIAAINMTPDSFAQAYSTGLWLTPTALRGH